MSKRIVFSGLVDGGKSTLIGSLLIQMGVFTEEQYRQAERDAIANGMESWKWAYLLDETEYERSRGKTMEYVEVPCSYQGKNFIMVDTPGHNQLIKQMIEGCDDADIGVFLISCRKGEFEKSLQDVEHLVVLKCLGIAHLIVVFNKWDLLPEGANIEDMKLQVQHLLKKFGFKTFTICYTSGFLGFNLISSPSSVSVSVYPSPPLLQCILNLPEKKKEDIIPYSTKQLELKGLVIGKKMLISGYQAILHGGKITQEIEIKSIKPKSFARPSEECLLTIDLPHETIYKTNRFILRDGDQTVFLGVRALKK